MVNYQGRKYAKVKRHMLKEQGFAAITVTMIIMVVLVLITVGFTRLISREQRSTVDRQLSTQAFYVAEAGINDAIEAINDPNPLTRYTRVQKQNCGPETTGTHLTDFVLDNIQHLEYTCLLLDQSPSQLEYGSVSTTTPTIIPVNGVASDGVTPQNITEIWVSWEGSSVGTSPTFATTSPAFPVSLNWPSETGVLRVGITPASVLDRNTLIQRTFTAFLYPQAGSAGAPPDLAYTTGTTNQGPIKNANCNVGNKPTYMPRYCTVRITGLNESRYLLNLRSIYADSTVTIRAFNGSTQLRLAGAQAMIDVTGKANDVLRRVSVRVPSRISYAYPGFALESTLDLCKKYSVMPFIGGSGQPTTDYLAGGSYNGARAESNCTPTSLPAAPSGTPPPPPAPMPDDDCQYPLPGTDICLDGWNFDLSHIFDGLTGPLP